MVIEINVEFVRGLEQRGFTRFVLKIPTRYEYLWDTFANRGSFHCYFRGHPVRFV